MYSIFDIYFNFYHILTVIIYDGMIRKITENMSQEKHTVIIHSPNPNPKPEKIYI